LDIASCAYTAEPAHIRHAEMRAAASLFIQGSKSKLGFARHNAAFSAKLIDQLRPNRYRRCNL
jgi:hypothetical protein